MVTLSSLEKGVMRNISKSTKREKEREWKLKKSQTKFDESLLNLSDKLTMTDMRRIRKLHMNTIKDFGAWRFYATVKDVLTNVRGDLKKLNEVK